MSSSDEEESLQEEKWDDMAIVRAFEDALRGKQSEKRTPPTSRSQGKSRPRKEASRRKQSAESERGQGSAPTWTPGIHTSANMAANGVNAYPHTAYAHAPQAQSQEDIYQSAYMQAYAHLQAQLQGGYHQPQTMPAPSHPPQQGNYSYPPQSHWGQTMHTSTPPVPPGMPFPTATGSNVPGFGSPGGSEDDLANLLMSWYQSGYYTGRYQAMQEMRGKSSR